MPTRHILHCAGHYAMRWCRTMHAWGSTTTVLGGAFIDAIGARMLHDGHTVATPTSGVATSSASLYALAVDAPLPRQLGPSPLCP